MRANPGNSGELSSAVEVSFHLVSVGMIAMVVLGVMGYLYYAMAEFILADEPEERVLSCARRSKMLMKGRRGVLMSLWLSFLLWYLLILMVSSMVAGIAGSVIALVLEMLGSLFLSVYMLASEGVFYEALRLAPAPEIPVESSSGDSQDDPQDPEL